MDRIHFALHCLLCSVERDEMLTVRQQKGLATILEDFILAEAVRERTSGLLAECAAVDRLDNRHGGS